MGLFRTTQESTSEWNIENRYPSGAALCKYISIRNWETTSRVLQLNQTMYETYIEQDIVQKLVSFSRYGYSDIRINQPQAANSISYLDYLSDYQNVKLTLPYSVHILYNYAIKYKTFLKNLKINSRNIYIGNHTAFFEGSATNLSKDKNHFVFENCKFSCDNLFLNPNNFKYDFLDSCSINCKSIAVCLPNKHTLLRNIEDAFKSLRRFSLDELENPLGSNLDTKQISFEKIIISDSDKNLVFELKQCDKDLFKINKIHPVDLYSTLVDIYSTIVDISTSSGSVLSTSTY